MSSTSSGSGTQVEPHNNQPKQLKKGVVETVFLFTVAGASVLMGFSRSFTAAKKQDQAALNKDVVRRFEGNALALRALGWGTAIAFTGCGLLFYGIWKALGVENFEEFRYKMGNFLPKIPKNPVDPNAKTEFKNLTELIQYIIDQDEVEKAKKLKLNSESSIYSSSSPEPQTK